MQDFRPFRIIFAERINNANKTSDYEEGAIVDQIVMGTWVWVPVFMAIFLLYS